MTSKIARWKYSSSDAEDHREFAGDEVMNLAWVGLLRVLVVFSGLPSLAVSFARHQGSSVRTSDRSAQNRSSGCSPLFVSGSPGHCEQSLMGQYVASFERNYTL